MRGLGQYLTRRVLGYLAIIAVAAVLSYAGIGNANAATLASYGCVAGLNPTTCDKGQAYAAATAYVNGEGNAFCRNVGYPDWSVKDNGPHTLNGSTRWTIKLTCKGTNAPATIYGVGEVSFHACASPKVWSDQTKTCFDPAQCLALNGQGFDPSVLRVQTYPAGTPAPNTYCPPSGCAFVRSGNGQGVCVGAECTNWSTWNYSGAMCTSNPADPNFKPAPPDPQLTDPNAEPAADKCHSDSVNNLTTCSKPNGQVCVTMKSGRRSCWWPGETGEKTDGPILQKRNAGNETVPPASLVLPSGDTLSKVAGPATLTTTKTDKATNTTTTSSTTTVNNYITNHGTNAGPTNQGEPTTDGSGEADGEGDGDGEDGEGGSVTGGAVCDAAPTCEGSAIDCAVLKQAWHTRCDGNSEGIAALEAFDQAHLDDALTEAVDNGAVLGIDGQGDVGNHRVLERFGGEGLNAGGFLGSGGCPSFPTPQVKGMPVVIDFQKICDLLSTISNLVMGLAYYLSFRIIAGGGSK